LAPLATLGKPPPLEEDATLREYSSPACLMHELAPVFAGQNDVQIKRIYDEPLTSDGYRVLVDRIWPRGLRKRDAAIDQWLRDLAPSTELRKWFGHDPDRWGEFRQRYRTELDQHGSLLRELRRRAAHQRVTLLYSAKNRQLNQAVVLREAILQC